MKIQIKDEEMIMTLSDESLDNDSFIDITIAGKMSGDIISMTVPIRDLFSAVIAFDAKRSKRLSEEEYMD